MALRISLPATKRCTFSSAIAIFFTSSSLESIVLLLAPIVPHICHALWRQLGHDSSLLVAAWPATDDSALVQDTIEIVVQVNGKLRARITIPVDASEDDVKEMAIADENVQRFIAGKEIRKAIVVPGRLVNVVV